MSSENIEHAGVKGMKWGVRRAGKAVASTASAAPKESRKERRRKNNADILAARERQKERVANLDRQAVKTYLAKGDAAITRATVKYNKMEAETLNHPDTYTAMRMTSGERLTNNILAGAGLGLVVTAGILNLKR